MLQATLHGKLSDQVPEPQRLEDALTSTVFGVLTMVNATGVLREWLGRARDARGEARSAAGTAPPTAWFWPRLAYAEPDVILRLGERLFVIEAKYRSGRHDAASAEAPDGDEPPAADQLLRQYRSIQALVDRATVAEPALVNAVSQCSVTFVYLVDGHRLHRARREINESAGLFPADADLRLLTWQDLYSILHSMVADGAAPEWAAALLAYFDLTRLDAYCGLRAPVSLTDAQVNALSSWNAGRTWRPIGGFLASLEVTSIAAHQACILDWRSQLSLSDSYNWRGALAQAHVATTLRAWGRRPAHGSERFSLSAAVEPINDRSPRWVRQTLRHFRTMR